MGTWFHKPIVIVDADKTQCQALCSALERESYTTISFHTLANLENIIEKNVRQVVLVDLDSLPLDNRFFRRIKSRNPAACIIMLSSRRFHPELKEAMSQHIYACLGKPIDEEELLFWIKSLRDV